MQRAGVLLISVLCLNSLAADKPVSIRVRAGDFDRSNVVVSVVLSEKARGQLRAPDGKTVPVQIDDAGRGWFQVSALKKGATAEYVLNNGTPAAGDKVAFEKDGTQLKGTISGHAALAYQAEAGQMPRPNIEQSFHRGGYIHPLVTLSGKVVSDDYPANHLHHHGIWWAWTKTEFQGREPDFWNMGQKKGRGEFVSLDQNWSGPVQGGFRARHRFVDLTAPTPVVAMNDTWEVRAYAAAPGDKYWILDLMSTQTATTSDPLKLPKYHYGGLGFRGNWGWNGKDKCSFLTSEGETDREKGNFTRGRWCDIAGDVDGQMAGIAILSHPKNFGAPQPMRLHPTEPFFCFAPQQLGDMEITPEKPYVSRYRFVVHDGAMDKATIDRLWNDFAQPPQVEVVAR